MDTQQDEQLIQIVSLLKELGYDLTKEESKVFVDVVIESLEQVQKGKSIEEIHELIQAKKTSPIYVELAYFVYERGMPYIHESLNQFHASRNTENGDVQLCNAVFLKDTNGLDVYDAAYYVVKYLDEHSNENKGNVKIKNSFANVK